MSYRLHEIKRGNPHGMLLTFKIWDGKVIETRSEAERIQALNQHKRPSSSALSKALAVTEATAIIHHAWR